MNYINTKHILPNTRSIKENIESLQHIDLIKQQKTGINQCLNKQKGKTANYHNL